MRFKPTEIVSMSVAMLAFLGSLLSAYYAYSNRNRELDIKLVELGIGILRSDPKETGLTAARGWAVQVIEENSRIKLSEDDRSSLLHKPLSVGPRKGFVASDPLDLEDINRKLEQIERIIGDAMRPSPPAPSDPPPKPPPEPDDPNVSQAR